MHAIKKRQWLWLGLAGIHLIMVGFGAESFNFSRLGALGDALDYYGTVTGSGNTYSFFAPGVGVQTRAEFDVVQKDGAKITTRLLSNTSHEADLRIGDIIDQFDFYEGDDNNPREKTAVHRSLAASLAGTVFGRFPEARSVTVRLEEYNPVSVAAYQRGERAQWAPQYSAKFEKSE